MCKVVSESLPRNKNIMSSSISPCSPLLVRQSSSQSSNRYEFSRMHTSSFFSKTRNHDHRKEKWLRQTKQKYLGGEVAGRQNRTKGKSWQKSWILPHISLARKKERKKEEPQTSWIRWIMPGRKKDGQTDRQTKSWSTIATETVYCDTSKAIPRLLRCAAATTATYCYYFWYCRFKFQTEKQLQTAYKLHLRMRSQPLQVQSTKILTYIFFIVIIIFCKLETAKYSPIFSSWTAAAAVSPPSPSSSSSLLPPPPPPLLLLLLPLAASRVEK